MQSTVVLVNQPKALESWFQMAYPNIPLSVVQFCSSLQNDTNPYACQLTIMYETLRDNMIKVLGVIPSGTTDLLPLIVLSKFVVSPLVPVQVMNPKEF